ncbi:hypothetical protein SAMN04487950_1719 [Halogranum rubrum]|uniref:DUF8054 domain-containing protein n=1 Tax=Halogranum rubrum TaxID=553466 RepID=A0A1I4DWM5_9EURY|nr:hypothetical protein [Halogranum rubrum]SFK97984.1 hypothetical protein SAMN04487950_1719 [Halogranum rubrum]
MRLPEGDLVRSRVVSDPGAALSAALDRRLTGYAVFRPQDTLLLGGDRRAVLTFEGGVPVLAYDGATDRGGAEALGDLAVPGPYKVELYELSSDALSDAHDTPELRVSPEMPAEELAADSELAERTRVLAPDDREEQSQNDKSALEAFLDDEEKIAAIREQAREEAEQRAEEWGFDDALDR